MINAVRIAAEFEGLLPQHMSTEHTEGYEGFLHLTKISGGVGFAEMQYLIRDHDEKLFEDKKELMKSAAAYINAIYGDVFTVPEAYIGKVGAKIMSLQDPSKKMSKSDENPNASIYLMDDADTIRRKCKRAVTDSEGMICYREEQPGIRNLLDIYSACTGKTPDEAVKEFEGCGYGQLKEAVGEAVVSVLMPLQQRVRELEADKAYIDRVIRQNAEKAAYTAAKTLRKVQKKVGFPERIR
jgi:tryptophanyl-tRNA synthetase